MLHFALSMEALSVRIKKPIFAIIFLVLSVFCAFSITAHAEPEDFASLEVSNNSDSLETQDVSDEAALNELLAHDTMDEKSDDLPAVTVTGDSFGLTGPLKLGTTFSENFGAIFNAQFVQALNYSNAIALALDLGSKEYRFSGTWGYAINNSQRVKLTGEYLVQKLDFDFASGTETESIGQAAVGLAYQLLLSKKFVHALNVTTTYSKAQSKDLGIKYYTSGSDVWENWRRVAGGKDKSVSAGLDFVPTKTTLFGLSLDYDSISYDTTAGYTSDTSDDSEDSGFGATATLDQLINKYLKIRVTASNRKVYNNYKAELSWLAVTDPNYRLEFGISGEKISGGNSDNASGDDTRFGVDLNYKWGSESFDVNEKYGIQTDNSSAFGDLASWVSTPAVHMEKVLAIKEEKNIKLAVPTTDGLNGKTIPTDIFPDVTFSYGEDIGVLDVTKFFDFGNAHSLQSITAPDLEQYGLKFNLENGGTKVTLTGTPKALAAHAPISYIITNAGGLSSAPGTFYLDIGSAVSTITIEPVLPFLEGQYINPNDAASLITIATITFGGEAGATVTIDTAKLDEYGLQAIQTDFYPGTNVPKYIKLASKNGVNILKSTAGLPDGIDKIHITINNGGSSSSGDNNSESNPSADFPLIIIGLPIFEDTGGHPVSASLSTVESAGAAVDMPIGFVNWENGVAGQLKYDATNFANCFVNTTDPNQFSISLVGTTIQLKGKAATSTPGICEGNLTAQDQEGLSSQVKLSVQLTDKPTMEIYNPAAIGAAGQAIKALPPTGDHAVGAIGKVKTSGMNGTLTHATLNPAPSNSWSTCFKTAPTFKIATTNDILISTGGALLDSVKNSCSLSVVLTNDQGVSSDPAVFNVTIAGSPTLTSQPLSIFSGEKLQNGSEGVVANVQSWGGTSSSGNLILDDTVKNSADFTKYFDPSSNPHLDLSTSDTGSNVAEVLFSAVVKDLTGVTIPAGQITYKNAIKVYNSDGGFALADLLVTVIGEPTLTPVTGDAIPSIQAGAGPPANTIIGGVVWGVNSDGSSITRTLTFSEIDAANPCFSTAPTLATTSISGNQYSITLSGGVVSARLNKAGICTFTVTAQNGSAPAVSNSNFAINITPGQPIITLLNKNPQLDPSSLIIPITNLAYIDWAGAQNTSNHSSTGLKVSILNDQRTTCFKDTNNSVDWYYDTPESNAYDGTIKLLSGTANPPQQDDKHCDIMLRATNYNNGNPLTSVDTKITVDYVTTGPSVDPINTISTGLNVSSSSSSAKTSTITTTDDVPIAKVNNWGLDGNPDAAAPLTIYDKENSCFVNAPAYPDKLVLESDGTVIVKSGAQLSSLPGNTPCVFTLVATNSLGDETRVATYLITRPVVDLVTTSVSLKTNDPGNQDYEHGQYIPIPAYTGQDISKIYVGKVQSFGSPYTGPLTLTLHDTNSCFVGSPTPKLDSSNNQIYFDESSIRFNSPPNQNGPCKFTIDVTDPNISSTPPGNNTTTLTSGIVITPVLVVPNASVLDNSTSLNPDNYASVTGAKYNSTQDVKVAKILSYGSGTQSGTATTVDTANHCFATSPTTNITQDGGGTWVTLTKPSFTNAPNGGGACKFTVQVTNPALKDVATNPAINNYTQRDSDIEITPVVQEIYSPTEITAANYQAGDYIAAPLPPETKIFVGKLLDTGTSSGPVIIDPILDTNNCFSGVVPQPNPLLAGSDIYVTPTVTFAQPPNGKFCTFALQTTNSAMTTATKTTDTDTHINVIPVINSVISSTSLDPVKFALPDPQYVTTSDVVIANLLDFGTGDAAASNSTIIVDAVQCFKGVTPTVTYDQSLHTITLPAGAEFKDPPGPTACGFDFKATNNIPLSNTVPTHIEITPVVAQKIQSAVSLDVNLYANNNQAVYNPVSATDVIVATILNPGTSPSPSLSLQLDPGQTCFKNTIPALHISGDDISFQSVSASNPLTFATLPNGNRCNFNVLVTNPNILTSSTNVETHVEVKPVVQQITSATTLDASKYPNPLVPIPGVEPITIAKILDWGSANPTSPNNAFQIADPNGCFTNYISLVDNYDPSSKNFGISNIQFASVSTSGPCKFGLNVTNDQLQVLDLDKTTSLLATGTDAPRIDITPVVKLIQSYVTLNSDQYKSGEYNADLQPGANVKVAQVLSYGTAVAASTPTSLDDTPNHCFKLYTFGVTGSTFAGFSAAQFNNPPNNGSICKFNFSVQNANTNVANSKTTISDYYLHVSPVVDVVDPINILVVDGSTPTTASPTTVANILDWGTATGSDLGNPPTIGAGSGSLPSCFIGTVTPYFNGTALNVPAGVESQGSGVTCKFSTTVTSQYSPDGFSSTTTNDPIQATTKDSAITFASVGTVGIPKNYGPSDPLNGDVTFTIRDFSVTLADPSIKDSLTFSVDLGTSSNCFSAQPTSVTYDDTNHRLIVNSNKAIDQNLAEGNSCNFQIIVSVGGAKMQESASFSAQVIGAPTVSFTDAILHNVTQAYCNLSPGVRFSTVNMGVSSTATPNSQGGSFVWNQQDLVDYYNPGGTWGIQPVLIPSTTNYDLYAYPFCLMQNVDTAGTFSYSNGATLTNELNLRSYVPVTITFF